MKKAFSTQWKASSQARKQRKYRHNAPKHVRGAFLNANLSKALREKHNRRSLRVRSGDEVEVLRGSFKGSKGVVDGIDTDKAKLLIRGVEHPRRDGSKRMQPVPASNVRIIKLTEDNRRI